MLHLNQSINTTSTRSISKLCRAEVTFQVVLVKDLIYSSLKHSCNNWSDVNTSEVCAIDRNVNFG